MESFITLHQIWLHSQSTPNNFPLFREENIWRQLWKIHFSANLSLETSENEQGTKKVPPIRRWDCVSANLKAVSSTRSGRFGKIMGRQILLEKIKFSIVFSESDLWAPVKCCWRDVLSGVMGYERMLLWRKFPINCVHPTASAKFSLKTPIFILFSAFCLLSCVSKP